jgi:hypothetical protein
LRALGYQDPADWLDDITKESAVEVEAPDPLVSDGRSGIHRVKRMALAVGTPVVGSKQDIQDNLRAADSADEEDVLEHGVRRDDRNAPCGTEVLTSGWRFSWLLGSPLISLQWTGPWMLS